MFHAIRSTITLQSIRFDLRANIIAGLTVGIVALPLSMALAIAVGVPPQHGLYTAIVAGAVIALTGGSPVNISGPTAAFVVVLLPIVQDHGLGGLMLAGMLAGLMLMTFGFVRLGNLIEVVPYPVTIGFTAGIGIVLATLQIKDFLGLNLNTLSGDFIHKVTLIFIALPTLNWQETSIGAVTLMVLLFWPRINKRLPAHLVALSIATVIAWLGSYLSDGFHVATIGSRFNYIINGLLGTGIPPVAPSFIWPWEQAGSDGYPIGWSFELLHELFGAALTIAVLGALESLLCAVVADGMSGKRHDPNDELIGQGLGNLITPLFGGIPATAAIARTVTNIRAGATSPLAAVIHAIFLLAAMLLFAPWLSYIPMSALAALLMIVAWNMSDAKHFIRTLRIAPGPDRATLLVCCLLTVLFDMVIAVGVGMALAGILFIHRSIALTGVAVMDAPRAGSHVHQANLPANLIIYDINGPLFFGSAQRALRNLTAINPGIRTVILDMTDVTMLDMSGIIAMESIVKSLKNRRISLVIANLAPRMVEKLQRAGIPAQLGRVEFTDTLADAISYASSKNNNL